MIYRNIAVFFVASLILPNSYLLTAIGKVWLLELFTRNMQLFHNSFTYETTSFDMNIIFAAVAVSVTIMKL